MSSRWPQDQQDQRSPYAPYDESWNQDNDAAQPGQDAGWQEPDGGGYPGQWSAGSAQRGTATAQAVADPWAPARSDDPYAAPETRSSARQPADQLQQDWDQGAGGFGDDADYEWFSYLSGGRSASAKPEATPRPGPPDSGRSRDKRRDRDRDRDGDREQPARRGLRGRRGHDRSAPAPDLDYAAPPDRDRLDDVTDPGRRAAPPDRDWSESPDTGSRRHGRSAPGEPGRRRRGRSAPADSGPVGPQAPAPSVAADPGPSWPGYGSATTDPGLNWPASDPGYRPAATDPGPPRSSATGRHSASAGRPSASFDMPGWPGHSGRPDPAADQPYSPPGVPGWPDPAGLTRADPGFGQPADHRGYAEPEAVGWPGVTGDQRYTSADAPAWPGQADDLRYAPPAAPGWPGPAGDQRHAAGWTGSADDQRYAHLDAPGWPGAAADQPGVPGWPDPAGLAHAGHGPAVLDDHRGYAEPEAVGWPAVTDDLPYQSPDAPGWPGVPLVTDDRPYAPSDAPGWPEMPGFPVAADPDQDGLDTAHPRTGSFAAAAAGPDPRRPGSRRGDRGGKKSADRRPATGVKTRENRARPLADDDVATGSTPAGTQTRPAPDKKRSGRKPAKPKRGKQPRGRQPAGTPAATLAAPVLDAPAPSAPPVTERPPARAPARKRRGRRTKQIVALAGASAVLAGGVVIFMNRSSGGSGVAHVLTAPQDLGVYAKQPQLANQMHAAALRQQILRESAGGASNVIYAVYQDSTGPAAAAGPQIVLFIGGNLTGTSGGGFISTFTGKLPGAQTTNPGPLGGAAACAPSVDGRLAECVWADNDTFGVVASQTLSTPALAAEMRQMRPMIEHRAGTQQ